MKKIRVGVIGCGAIGSFLALRIERDLYSHMCLTGVCDVDKNVALGVVKDLKQKVPVLSFSSLLKRSDLLIEATSVSSCRKILPKIIEKGKDVLVMSVGGVLASSSSLKDAAKTGSKVYIPSGAIAGLDAAKAAALGRIEKVSLITSKPYASLVLKSDILKKFKAKKPVEIEIFSGNASQAIKKFPANINVAAALSLATIGKSRVRVSIVASNVVKNNIHEIQIKGSNGCIFTRTENVTSKENPKTSFLAMLSALAVLRSMVSSIKIGT